MRGFWIVFAFAPQAVSADRWFGSDKIQHFVSSAFVQAMGYSALRVGGAAHSTALLGASVATAAVGVTKEWHDRNTQGDFSGRDLVWDAAGGGAMSVLLTQTRR
jgi:putative lipoprotein